MGVARGATRKYVVLRPWMIGQEISVADETIMPVGEHRTISIVAVRVRVVVSKDHTRGKSHQMWLTY
jgi:hypothetical protein